jgi:RNA polymerase sigma-70 factor (ECF subfamily)
MGSRRDRFCALYEENYHRILGYALRRTDSSEAADVVAETFTTAWRRLDAVPEGEEARLWLYGTARRVLANHHRARRRRERLAGRLQEQAPAPLESERDEVGALSAAFARLREDERELLTLAGWEELGAGEIAEVLGCSRNAARTRLHRARRRLAQELGRSKRQSGGGHVSLVSSIGTEDLL